MLTDVPLEVDLNDEEHVIRKVMDISERIHISAVYANNEYRTVLGARIAEALNLPYSLSAAAAQNCRSKARTRALLLEHQVNPVKYALIQSSSELPQVFKEISFPLIIKPSNDAGSFMVKKCTTETEAYEAFEQIKSRTQNWVGQPLEQHILVEEYVEGPEFSVETCTIAGVTRVIAITEKASFSVVEEGHSVPAAITEKQKLMMEELVIQALRVLGVDYIVAHTEVKLSPRGPVIIEVNARMGGDQIHQLVRAVTGYDLRQLALHVVTGGTWEEAPRGEPKTSTAQIKFLLADHDGKLEVRPDLARKVEGIQEVQLSVKNGDYVAQTKSNYDRLGYLIAFDMAHKTANQVMFEACDALRFSVIQAQEEKV
jgi:biotin carboxylase